MSKSKEASTGSTRNRQEMEGKRRSARRWISRSDGKTKGLIQRSRQAPGGIWICYYSCTFPTWQKLLCCAILCLQCETLYKHWPVPLAFISTKKGIKRSIHTVNIISFFMWRRRRYTEGWADDEVEATVKWLNRSQACVYRYRLVHLVQLL